MSQTSCNHIEQDLCATSFMPVQMKGKIAKVSVINDHGNPLANPLAYIVGCRGALQLGAKGRRYYPKMPG